jgi:hypothetical protein
VAAYLNETGIGWGKYLKGSTGLTILFVVLALACLIGPWLRAMEAKANGGATDIQPKSQTYEHHNPHRLPGNLHTIYNCTDGILHS